MAVQTGLLAGLRVPFTAVFAGCVIPDMPWILRRAALQLGLVNESPEAVAYFMAQASLAATFAACLTVGLLHARWKQFTMVAWAGCALHLLLDSLQDKWGNGVHLLAPFDWTLFSIGIVPLDSTLMTIVSIAGLVPFLFVRKISFDAHAIRLTPIHLAVAALAAATYLMVPAVFIDDVIASDSRNLLVLSNDVGRVGAVIELDRESLRTNDSEVQITTHTGELLTIANPPDQTVNGVYSARAIFTSRDRIQLLDIKRHSLSRDIASYAGLGLIGAWCLAVVVVRLRYSSDT